MPTRSHVAALGFAALGLLGSCDTLKARHEANEAAALYKEGKLEVAAERYGSAEKLDPSIAAIHRNLGFTYMQLFSQSPRGAKADAYAKQAIDELEEFLKSKPKDEDGRKYLLQMFVDSKRYDDAVAFFKPEVEAAQPSVEAISILAQVAAKVGKFDEALTWYDKRIAIEPKRNEGYDGMGVLIWDYLHNHLSVVGAERIKLADRGIEALKKSIELNPFPGTPYTYVNLLYRERSTAHQCQVGDGGVAVGPPDGGVVDPVLGGCEQLRADLLEAEKYFKIASEKFKEAAGQGHKAEGEAHKKESAGEKSGGAK
jgi:tetratricopeptide (TPR) repeat protein